MAMNFPKGQRAIAFDRATAFPLDANAYFESLVDAKAAVKTAEEVGSKLSAYYFGQQIAVVENDVATLYLIEKVKVDADTDVREYEGQLKEVGSKTLGDGASIILDDQGVLSIYGFADAGNKCVPYKDAATGKIVWGTVEGLIPDAVVPVGDGETILVSVDESDESKRIISLLGKDGAADKAVLRKHIDGENVTYVWDVLYDKTEIDALVADLETKIGKKADTTTVTAVEGRVTTLEGKITGLTGAMHFAGKKTELPEDLTEYSAGDVIIVDKKEYVCVEDEGVKTWSELGDEGSHFTRTEAESMKKDIEDAAAEKYVVKDGNKVLSTNDYDNTAKGIVDGIEAKVTAAGTKAAEDLATAVEDLESKINGKQAANENLDKLNAITGEGLVKKTAEGYEVDTNEYITNAALNGYAKSTDVTTEINAAVANKQTAEQVNQLIKEATIDGGKVDGNVAGADIADKVANALTVGTKTYDGSTAVEITAADLGAITEIPQAMAEKLGGIKLGFEETDTQRAVQLDANGKAYVGIPAALLSKVNTEQFEIGEGKQLNLKAVSTDLLVQGELELQLMGGNAASFTDTAE